jgi:hypothetical protein
VALCVLGMGLVSAARSLVTGEAALLASSFLGGVLTSFWAVTVAPVVSGLTNERNRPLGFSVFFSVGIALGILGGLAGGRLPALAREAFALEGAEAKQVALLVGCAIMALAALPASRLAMPPAPPREARTWPWSPFLARYLAPLAIWSFAAGAFTPFFTAYFARQQSASEAQIGDVFSVSQLAQVGAVLLAPLVLGKFGLVGGVAGMQLAAGLALAGLAAGPSILGAAALYAALMSFQAMCEPGTYSLLMNRVPPEQRGGAAAFHFVVMFTSQAASAALAGAIIARLGYPVLLVGAGLAAAGGALLFRVLLRKYGQERIPAESPG